MMADLAPDPLAWRAVKAPSLAEFEVLAGEVFRVLPKTFREFCADVVIQVDDFPSEEVLEEMQAESEFDLLGLFCNSYQSTQRRYSSGRGWISMR